MQERQLRFRGLFLATVMLTFSFAGCLGAFDQRHNREQHWKPIHFLSRKEKWSPLMRENRCDWRNHHRLSLGFCDGEIRNRHWLYISCLQYLCAYGFSRSRERSRVLTKLAVIVNGAPTIVLNYPENPRAGMRFFSMQRVLLTQSPLTSCSNGIWLGVSIQTAMAMVETIWFNWVTSTASNQQKRSLCWLINHWWRTRRRGYRSVRNQRLITPIQYWMEREGDWSIMVWLSCRRWRVDTVKFTGPTGAYSPLKQCLNWKWRHSTLR